MEEKNTEKQILKVDEVLALNNEKSEMTIDQCKSAGIIIFRNLHILWANKLYTKATWNKTDLNYCVNDFLFPKDNKENIDKLKDLLTHLGWGDFTCGFLSDTANGNYFSKFPAASNFYHLKARTFPNSNVLVYDKDGETEMDGSNLNTGDLVDVFLKLELMQGQKNDFKIIARISKINFVANANNPLNDYNSAFNCLDRAENNIVEVNQNE